MSEFDTYFEEYELLDEVEECDACGHDLEDHEFGYCYTCGRDCEETY